MSSPGEQLDQWLQQMLRVAENQVRSYEVDLWDAQQSRLFSVVVAAYDAKDAVTQVRLMHSEKFVAAGELRPVYSVRRVKPAVLP